MTGQFLLTRVSITGLSAGVEIVKIFWTNTELEWYVKINKGKTSPG